MALAGALGYAFDLFGEIVPYDELTHAFTTFSVSLAFYFLFYGGAVPEGRAVALATSVFTLGVTVGAYWEIFEWFFVLDHGLEDLTGGLRGGHAMVLHRLRSIIKAKTTNTISATLNKTISMLLMTMAFYLQAFQLLMRKGPG